MICGGRCLGITLSFHRQLSHKSFQTPKWLEYALAYCGVLAVQVPHFPPPVALSVLCNACWGIQMAVGLHIHHKPDKAVASYCRHLCSV